MLSNALFATFSIATHLCKEYIQSVALNPHLYVESLSRN